MSAWWRTLAKRWKFFPQSPVSAQNFEKYASVTMASKA
jgi:hypothetical protein